MIKNLEFIKNRSFEIAWAVFRCATLVKNEDLKKELESASIKLAAKYGNSDSLKSSGLLVEEIPEVEKLISLIRLAEAIGEIRIINARVLYRELSNINEAIKEAEQALAEALADIRQLVDQKEVFIEGIFSSQTPVFKESGKQLDFKTEISAENSKLNETKNSVATLRPQVVEQSSLRGRQTSTDTKVMADRQGIKKQSLAESGNGDIGNPAKLTTSNLIELGNKPKESGKEKNNQAILRQASADTKVMADRQDVKQNSPAKSGNGSTKLTTNSPAIRQPADLANNELHQIKPSAAMVTGSRQNPSAVNSGPNGSPQVAELANMDVRPEASSAPREELVPESWEDLIYRKIKEVGKASSREMSAFFPEISERTIRFYLQRLQDLNFIERIGTFGPGGYYTLSNKANVIK